MTLRSYYSGKRILISGHTGFKGSWLSTWLHRLGAQVYGYSVDIPTSPSHFMVSRTHEYIEDHRGDLLDFDNLQQFYARVKPELVFHLAAQPIVRDSYQMPRETFNTNLMGTVNVLEAARLTPSVQTVLVVTSDKVYSNERWAWGYRETDRLGGRDPYSASKACAELATAVYQGAEFQQSTTPQGQYAAATARAGNVLGGGDWAKDRLVPDVVSALAQGRDIHIRNPQSTRPWQHVLDALHGYLLLAKSLHEDPQRFASCWNFGPDGTKMTPVIRIVEMLLRSWNHTHSRIVVHPDPCIHEEATLRVDASKAIQQLGWVPIWDTEEAVHRTAEWYAKYYSGTQDMRQFTLTQIEEFENAAADILR